MVIDLNADLGEGANNDEALLALVTSANIACGFHAGDADAMQQSIRWARQHGVAIGAHPSFPDRQNFGRTAMQLAPTTIYNQMIYQLGALAALVAQQTGIPLTHVKPHGMLYNQAAKEPILAQSIAHAVKDFDNRLRLVGLANSELTRAGEDCQLTVYHEVFADRRYCSDGSLVPRTHPLALIEQSDEAIEQTLEMIINQRVQTINGQWIKVKADTVCLHGDGPHALIFAQQLRTALQQEGITLSASRAKAKIIDRAITNTN